MNSRQSCCFRLFWVILVGVLVCSSIFFGGLAVLELSNQYWKGDQPIISMELIVNAQRFDVFGSVIDSSAKFANLWSSNNETIMTKLVGEGAKALTTEIVDAVEGRVPVVLVSNSVSQWQLLKADWWNISLSWPLLLNVLSLRSTKRSDDNPQLEPHVNDKTFIIQDYVSEAGGRIATGVSRHRQIDVKDYFLTNFLSEVRNRSRCSFYSTDFRVMESLVGLSVQSWWKDFRIIERIAVERNISNTTISPQLSMLYPGCALQARYSESHSFKVQVQGKGRYLVYPLQHIKDMYLYPSIHVSAFQSQVSFADLDEQKDIFPRFRHAKYAEVALNPGEVLYVPPFHMVRSEARTLSVTLDVLSPSQEQILLTEAFLSPLPFDNTTSSSQEARVVSSQVFLVHVLSRLAGLSSVRKFARALLNSRFYPVLSPKGSLVAESSTFTCYNDQRELHGALVEK